MRVLLLGAGQDVGRSCVVVRIGGKTLMFDCGMHMGYQDARRFPDFSLLSPSHDYTSVIDAVFISHFHMDHVGALPYFTEVCGYQGPVFMTYPTRAIAPLMLHDFYRVLIARPGTGPLFAARHIDAAMSKVRLMDLQETLQVGEGVEVTPYYAGHVLGAAMLHVRVGAESLVYTGDFNTVPERHLAGASIPRLCPDLLITESTYATSIREDRRARERQLLNMVHQTVTSGGKVLVPVFAVGRAQELLMLLDEHWSRTGLQVPIYVSSIMATRANAYFKLLQNWASERVKQAAPGCRAAAFDFSRVQDWKPELIDAPGACVLFATPGMLHGGTSLEVFKAWAPDPNNLVLLPSYQVAGTVGRKLLMGVRQGLQVDSKTQLDVHCKVDYAALSAHTDAKGILQVVQQVAPAAVMLVHGEHDKMAFMCDKVQRSQGIPCYMPANGEEVQIDGAGTHNLPVSAQLLRQLPDSIQGLQQQQQQLKQLKQSEQQEPSCEEAAHAVGGSSTLSVAEAAAGWLQQGDVGQLAAAAMRLAGLTPAGSSAGGSSAAPGANQQQPQQQLVQMHGTPAAARAAQLAPWLELLAAAAQDANQQQQQQQQREKQVVSVSPSDAGGAAVHQQQQMAQAATGLPFSAQEQQGPASPSQQSPAARPAVSQQALVSVAQELQQQLRLEEQGVVVDGMLLLHHSTAAADGQAGATHQHVQQVQLELLPADAAAAALQLQQQQIKITSTVRLGSWFVAEHQPAASGEDHEAGAGNEHRDTSMRAATDFMASVLRRNLPATVGQLVQVVQGAAQVQLRSIVFKHAAEASDSGCWKCSWYLKDDALAQRCVSLLQQQSLA